MTYRVQLQLILQEADISFPEQLSGICCPQAQQLLGLLTEPKFRWLWTLDIINDYERGAEAIESDNRIVRRAEFDRVGFQLFLAALQLWPPVAVSIASMRNARRRISQHRVQRSVILTMQFI